MSQGFGPRRVDRRMRRDDLDQLGTTLVLGAATVLTLCLMALAGLWPELPGPRVSPTHWLKAISGGYFVRLSHDGEQGQFGFWQPEPPEQEVRGIVTSVRSSRQTEPLRSLAIHDSLISYWQDAEPMQLDLDTDEGVDWRLEAAAFANDQQLSIDLSGLVGRRVRIRAQSITFGVTTFHWLRLDDEQGPVLQLDHRLPDAFESELEVAVGERLATLPSDCSDLAIHTLELAGQNRLVVAPGQEGALRFHDRDYRAWNLDTSLIAGNERCTCLVHHVAWMVLRAQ